MEVPGGKYSGYEYFCCGSVIARSSLPRVMDKRKAPAECRRLDWSDSGLGANGPLYGRDP